MFGNKKSATQRREEADQRYIRTAASSKANTSKVKRTGRASQKALKEEQSLSGGSTSSNPLTRKRLGLPPLKK